jgi:hypothetical protein
MTSTAYVVTGPDSDDRKAAVGVFAAWLATALLGVLIWLGTYSPATPPGCRFDCVSARDTATTTAMIVGIPAFAMVLTAGAFALALALSRGARGWLAGTLGAVAGLTPAALALLPLVF